MIEFAPPPDWVYCERCRDWFPPKMDYHCWLMDYEAQRENLRDRLCGITSFHLGSADQTTDGQ